MPRKKQAEPVGHTVVELAQAFEMPEQTIRSFVAQIKPNGKKGRGKTYDFKEVKKVLASKRPKRARSEEAKNLEERKLELQCRKLEVEIDEKLGKLIPADEVRRFVATHTSAVTMHLRKMGGELSPQLQGLSVARTEKKISASAEELISKLREMPWENDGNRE